MAVVLPDSPNTVKFLVQGSTQGAPFTNTGYIRGSTGNFTQGEMDALASQIADAYWTNFGPVLNSSTLHFKTTCVDLSSRQGLFGFNSTSHNGTHGGVTVSSVQIACCISWLIQDRYRGGHPRMYLPAADAGDIQQGRYWTTLAMTNYQTAAAGFHVALQGLSLGGRTWTHGVVRYYAQSGQLQDPPLWRPITQASVHNRVDSMRRRLGKETV